METDNELNGAGQQEEITKLGQTVIGIEVDPRAGPFQQLGVPDKLVEVVNSIGWTEPSPIQTECLPFTLKGKDVAGFAQTGTGKTGVFLLTIANAILSKPKKESEHKVFSPRALVLVPTRELAMQVQEDAAKIFTSLNMDSLSIFGGSDMDKQISRLKDKPDLVVATTGRLLDLYKKQQISLKDTEIFICDEADRMFDMGFIDDVEFCYKNLNPQAQKLLFSATSNDSVKELAFQYLEEPEYISLNTEILTPEGVEQHLILCDSTNKLQVMIGLLREHKPKSCIIFTNTKLTAEWLHYKLQNNGFEDVELITGNLPQPKRTALITKIKTGQNAFLIATDVASRGIHITNLGFVFNFDVPDDAANYVHRIGRTARAGATGHAYSLICEQYGENLLPIKKMLGDTLPPSEWFNPEFLNIVDNADNPLKKRGVAEEGDESGAYQDRRPRHGASSGRDGGRGPRDGSRDGGRGPRGRGGRDGGRSERRPDERGPRQERRPHEGGASADSPRGDHSRNDKRAAGPLHQQRSERRPEGANQKGNQPQRNQHGAGSRDQGRRPQGRGDQTGQQNSSQQHQQKNTLHATPAMSSHQHEAKSATAAAKNEHGVVALIGKVFKSIFGRKNS